MRPCVVMNGRLAEVVSGQWRQRTRGCSRLGISHNTTGRRRARLLAADPSTLGNYILLPNIHRMNMFTFVANAQPEYSSRLERN